MFRYSVGSAGGPDELYISEIRLQCILAQQAYKNLDEYARAIVNKVGPYDHSPLFVIAQCVGFLSAAANISKILFPSPNANQAAQTRGTRLLTRLKLSSLPTIESRSVRNSFEHIDERLDKLVANYQNQTVCMWDLTDAAPAASIALKQLDPKLRVISFLGQSIDLDQCYQEIQSVENSLGL